MSKRKFYKLNSDNSNKSRYFDRFSIEKEKCNKFVAECMENNWNILILDGENMRTTNMLIDSGIKPKQITVVERDIEIFKKMCDKKLGVNLYNATLEEYVKKYSVKKFQIVYFDFCCTIVGSVTNDDYPLEVISKFLEKNCRECLLMAFTFCKRCKYVAPDHSLEDFLKEIMHYHQYDFNLLQKYDYINFCNNMVFYLFELTKNREIDPESIEFDWNEKRQCCIGYRPCSNIIEIIDRYD